MTLTDQSPPVVISSSIPDDLYLNENFDRVNYINKNGRYALNNNQFFYFKGDYGILIDETGVFKTSNGGDTLTPIT